MATTDTSVGEILGVMKTPKDFVPRGLWVKALGLPDGWHAVEDFRIYIYATMGGGYDDIINTRSFCGELTRLDYVQLEREMPPVEFVCKKCTALIQEQL